jgi:hypothetical protein
MNMAGKTKTVDSLTAAVAVQTEKDNTPTVRIFIPLMPGEDSEDGVKIDHYEHVTIGNDTTLVRRGEYVDVPVPVFLQLRNKYPKL